jgi:hypothetical protein
MRTAGSDLLGILAADPDKNDEVEASYIAVAAVAGQSDWLVPERVTLAQSALAIWLMRQAGWDLQLADVNFGGVTQAVLLPSPDELSPNEPTSREEADAQLEAAVAEVVHAADRFGALTPEELHAWLEANFAALRAGTLSLEDLP